MNGAQRGDGYRPNDVNNRAHQSNPERRAGIRNGFRKAIYHMDDLQGNNRTGTPDAIQVDNPERRIRINVRNDGTRLINGNANYWDMRHEPLERAGWQKFVNVAKWPSKGGDRLQRADKRLSQFNNIQRDILTKLSNPNRSPFPPGANNLFDRYVQKVKELGQQFGQHYNDATADWGQDSFSDKLERTFTGAGEAEDHHRARRQASSELKKLNQELGDLNRDLKSVQQFQELKTRRVQGKEWSQNNEMYFSTAINNYYASLDADLHQNNREQHQKQFETIHAYFLKYDLENATPEQTPELTRLEWIKYPRQTREKKRVYKQRDKFNELEKKIAININASGFKSLEISQQHGVMKKAASLINEFKTSSRGALDPIPFK